MLIRWRVDLDVRFRSAAIKDVNIYHPPSQRRTRYQNLFQISDLMLTAWLGCQQENESLFQQQVSDNCNLMQYCIRNIITQQLCLFIHGRTRMIKISQQNIIPNPRHSKHLFSFTYFCHINSQHISSLS